MLKKLILEVFYATFLAVHNLHLYIKFFGGE